LAWKIATFERGGKIRQLLHLQNMAGEDIFGFTGTATPKAQESFRISIATIGVDSDGP